MENSHWYTLENIDAIESPGLIFYEDRIKENIQTLICMIDRSDRLRPHVKTHKSADVTKLLLEAGLRKFKCATIAEAEMLGLCEAPDVLLAYQPIGPNISRYISLQKKFPKTRFSCLLDQSGAGVALASAAKQNNIRITVYIDVNVGMNRTGILPQYVISLYGELIGLEGLELNGLHAYDGHIHESDFSVRENQARHIIQILRQLSQKIEAHYGLKPIVIAGGTPTFPVYSKETDFECSPGTFVLWDKGYQDAFTEQAFLPAALIISRIISLPGEDLICTDLGHKAVAAENPLRQRVVFLNAPGLKPKSHSEEHMVLEAKNDHAYRVGDVLYGLPFHICPTVALYEYATRVDHAKTTSVWPISSRKRKITI